MVVIGWGTSRLLPRYRLLPALAVTALGGIVAIYAVGVPWMAVVLGLDLGQALLTGAVGFLPGDVLKVIITVLVARQVHRAWPGLIPARR